MRTESNGDQERRRPVRSRETTARLCLFVGAAGSEVLFHVAHMISAPVVAEWVDGHLSQAQRQSVWHEALIEWLPSAVAAGSLLFLVRHVRSRVFFMYVRS
ncbi:MAG TPA: hypothetical protein VFK80_08390 [Limnochordia bacterium]|nr:hypothetical protein [Limnochordia bacterium]